MEYKYVTEGIFHSRPSRFTALVDIDGKREVCHVKNTGRCREILVPGAKVYLAEARDNPCRKTKFDLIAAEKGARIINIDSQAPNTLFREWAEKTGFFGENPRIRPETFYQHSRFDFFIETEKDKIFVEVKGVTLEEDGILKFPDAPTERGVRHVCELMHAVKNGYRACIFFIGKMENVSGFTPNREMHPAFADVLAEAGQAGVEIYCLSCRVLPHALWADTFVKIN